MVEVISSNDVKARKEHECGLCTEKIQKGRHTIIRLVSLKVVSILLKHIHNAKK